MSAPFVDTLVNTCQQYPEVKNALNVKHLTSLFNMMCRLEKQGDDDYRSIWLTAERGSIEDFGDFNEYLEEGDVNSRDEFEELWYAYYPDEVKWYNFAVSKYADVFYFYIDSKLTFQFTQQAIETGVNHDFHNELVAWLLNEVTDVLVLIQEDVRKYNEYVSTHLPHKKRTGRILRKDFWTIFPEEMEEFQSVVSPEVIDILDKIKEQSEFKPVRYLASLSAGDFFRVCQTGYDANGYFEKSDKILTAKEKYIAMADGRDCKLTQLNEDSADDFSIWYKADSHCGGHPWEICRGGNSTHISLYVMKDEEGWYFMLRGSSRVRVLETIKMAVAFYKGDIPFILNEAQEIFRMATGNDYIGIVPETVFPRYCHSYFPAEDKIIDFMNLRSEKSDEIIEKAFWYPLPDVKLIE